MRSSSHPPLDPLAQRRPTDASGVRPWPAGPQQSAPQPAVETDEERRKKATPDERPRRARRMARERANTPAARPTGRRMVSERPISPVPAAPVQRPPAPAVTVDLPAGPVDAERLHEVPIQQRSSAPPRRSPLRAPAVRAAIVAAVAIVLGSLLAALLR